MIYNNILYQYYYTGKIGNAFYKQLVRYSPYGMLINSLRFFFLQQITFCQKYFKNNKLYQIVLQISKGDTHQH